jgi:gliding motility-associated-like protein
VQVLTDFDVPNTFTPNNDGINDKWQIRPLAKFPIQWVQVFDRYGQLLFESHGYTQPWDGTYNGKPLPAGTYYYIIEVNGLLNPKTGYVTILR